MKENKRIEKELLFKNNIKDITSISLDSDYKISNKEINGNFIITGEYKIHEVSINREKFNFKIPFKYQLQDDLDETTVNVEITNFEYDYNKDELIVNIEYDITADKKDVLIFDNEESLEEFLSSREVEVVDTRLDDIKDKIEEDSKDNEIKNIEERTNETSEVENNIELVEIKEELVDVERTNETSEEAVEDSIEIDNNINIEREKVETDDIINNIGTIEDGFITYKVYTIKENESLESIVVKYHTTIDELKEYNDLNNLSVNDKLIIPQYEQ